LGTPKAGAGSMTCRARFNALWFYSLRSELRLCPGRRHRCICTASPRRTGSQALHPTRDRGDFRTPTLRQNKWGRFYPCKRLSIVARGLPACSQSLYARRTISIPAGLAMTDFPILPPDGQKPRTPAWGRYQGGPSGPRPCRPNHRNGPKDQFKFLRVVPAGTNPIFPRLISVLLCGAAMN
jgi:hypothetical protein